MGATCGSLPADSSELTARVRIGQSRPMVKAGLAALAILVSAPVASPAAAAVPLRFSKPVTVGRWVNNGSLLRAVDLSGDGIPDLASSDGETDELSVWLGKGDGSFRARRDYRIVGEVF